MKKVGIIGIICLIILNILVIILPIFLVTTYKKEFKEYDIAPTPIVKNISIDEENNVNVKVGIDDERLRNDIYYLYKTDDVLPSVSDDEWKKLNHGEFSFKLDKNVYYAFLKNEDNEIYKVNNLNEIGKVISLDISKEKVYIAVKGKYTVSATYDYIGYVDEGIKWYSENEKIAKVDKNGKITGVKKGTTKIHASIGDKDVFTTVLVTNLITVRPKKYNSKKSYLPCGKYSKEDNDLLDEILKDRVNDVGYKTRAAAVETARFLALEFPYKIRYFSENGRGNTNGVDGEGRYYHIGLYLDESRFKNIKKRLAGPATWGCSMYSRPSHGQRPNGFDCSGFVSWALYNAGFDVGDISAGLDAVKDLTDYGVRTKFTAEIVKSGKVKVGDLLSSGGVGGGHIAIIVGEDKDYYYVAESLWTPPNVAVVILPYSKKNLFNRYYYVMFMDSYYKKDGKLTKLWY